MTNIKIRTKNVGRSADLWGYTLRVNNLYLKMDFSGYNTESVRLTEHFEQATIFSNVASLRRYWANYMQLICAYAENH